MVCLTLALKVSLQVNTILSLARIVACKGNSIQKLTFRITNPMQNKNTEKNIEIKFYNKCLKLLGSKCYQ